jgi:hypothetical protein
MAPTPTLYADLIAAQKAFPSIKKDNTADTGKFKYKYADLGDILDAVKPILNANNFALVQATGVAETGDMTVETRLYHVSGDHISSSYPVRCVDPNDPQKIGGALTYARRYALMAMLGLAAEDDDGQHARALSHVATSRPQTRQHVPEKAPDMSDFDLPTPAKSSMPDDVFGAEVRLAITQKDGELLRSLVDEAGDHVGRWIALVKASDTPAALEWMEKQIVRRNIVNDLLVSEIEKRRAAFGKDAPSPTVRSARRENALPNLTPGDVEAGRVAAERALR